MAGESIYRESADVGMVQHSREECENRANC